MNRSRATYGRRQQRPPPLAAERFQEMATSPKLNSNENNHHRSGGCTQPHFPTSSCPAVEDAISQRRSMALHATSPRPSLNTQPSQHHDDPIPTYSSYGRRPLRRLFQNKQPQIIVRRTDQARSQQNSRNKSDLALLPEESSAKIAGLHKELLLDTTHYSPTGEGGCATGKDFDRDHPTPTSSVESCSPMPKRSWDTHPLSALRRKLDSCVLLGLPTHQVPAYRQNRDPWRSKQSSAATIGDGFEGAELLMRPLTKRGKGRKKLMPRRYLCRQLILVACSPHDITLESQHRLASRIEHGTDVDFLTPSQHSARSRETTIDPMIAVEHGFSEVDEKIQHLLKSISAPPRRSTSSVETSSDTRSCSSHDSAVTSFHSKQDGSRLEVDERDEDSWEGLVSSQSMLSAVCSPDQLVTSGPIRPSSALLSSPVPSLMSSSDIFEILEEVQVNAASTYHPHDAVDLANDTDGRVARIKLDSLELLNELKKEIQILDSEAIVLETSQCI